MIIHRRWQIVPGLLLLSVLFAAGKAGYGDADPGCTVPVNRASADSGAFTCCASRAC